MLNSFLFTQDYPTTFNFLSYISSFQLMNESSDIMLEPNFQLIFLDVISLFTNVLLDLAINSISKRIVFLKELSVPIEEFLNTIRPLNSTFFWIQ